MEEIALGSLNSKLYEKGGEQYYKISPIFGQQINFFLDAPVSEIHVLKSTEQELLIKNGRLKLKMIFKPYVPGLFKLRLTPIYFGLRYEGAICSWYGKISNFRLATLISVKACWVTN
jgi:hypothetical protein